MTKRVNSKFNFHFNFSLNIRAMKISPSIRRITWLGELPNGISAFFLICREKGKWERTKNNTYDLSAYSFVLPDCLFFSLSGICILCCTDTEIVLVRTREEKKRKSNEAKSKRNIQQIILKKLLQYISYKHTTNTTSPPTKKAKQKA